MLWICGSDRFNAYTYFNSAELLLGGVENASLRKGNMYELPFADHEFDTVILDDVLGVIGDAGTAKIQVTDRDCLEFH